MKLVIRNSRTTLLLVCFVFIGMGSAISRADFPQPRTDSFTDAQHLRWSIYAYTVRPGIFLYNQINAAVDKREAIVKLATTVFSSTLSIKSLLNPNTSDFSLFGAELDFVGILSGWDVEAEIADMFVAGLPNSLGSPTAIAKYCPMKTVSSITKLYDTIELWKLAEKANLASALNEFLWNLYAFGGDLNQIQAYHGRFEPKYLQNYLDEYVFRFNRRKSKSIGKKFMRLVQQAVKSAKVTYEEIKWDIDPISEYFAT